LNCIESFGTVIAFDQLDDYDRGDKMRIVLLLLALVVSIQLVASQRFVVGEVFTNDPDC
jgi:hypothetical protein